MRKMKMNSIRERIKKKKKLKGKDCLIYGFHLCARAVKMNNTLSFINYLFQIFIDVLFVGSCIREFPIFRNFLILGTAVEAGINISIIDNCS